MTIQLSNDREQFVRSLVRDGHYSSEEAVVDEALCLLQERDDQARLAELRHDIAVGIEQADRGELGPFDPNGTLARIRSRHAAGKGQA